MRARAWPCAGMNEACVMRRWLWRKLSAITRGGGMTHRSPRAKLCLTSDHLLCLTRSFGFADGADGCAAAVPIIRAALLHVDTVLTGRLGLRVPGNGRGGRRAAERLRARPQFRPVVLPQRGLAGVVCSRKIGNDPICCRYRATSGRAQARNAAPAAGAGGDGGGGGRLAARAAGGARWLVCLVSRGFRASTIAAGARYLGSQRVRPPFPGGILVVRYAPLSL